MEDYIRIEKKIDELGNKLEQFCLNVTSKMAAGDVKITRVEKDVDSLWEAYRSSRATNTGLILGCFTVLGIMITIFKFIG